MSAAESGRCRGLVVTVSIVVPVAALCALVAWAWIRRPLPLPPPSSTWGHPWESQKPVYNGKGILVAFMGKDALRPEGTSVRYEEPLHSRLLRKDRPLLVYLPPGYKDEGPAYPVMFALHGYSTRPQTWATLLIGPLERAFAAGTVPPLVVVMPDLSISGNGTDDPSTWFDDRSGNFCINSNLGRFEDHFFEEIAPFVFSTFNVRTDPRGVVMIGSSMGGYGALYYAVRHPSFSHLLVPIYPSADLRYGVRGNKLADFDPAGYALIATDDPARIVNGAALGGAFRGDGRVALLPGVRQRQEPGRRSGLRIAPSGSVCPRSILSSFWMRERWISPASATTSSSDPPMTSISTLTCRSSSRGWSRTAPRSFPRRRLFPAAGTSRHSSSRILMRSWNGLEGIGKDGDGRASCARAFT